ncbi:hypothetical protein I79_009251 [Cricetulus griseus]|uniref:Uncharacterized protein n=1 Tax=Cricetulus griseus TaxID=10029 RepID=G3HF95_CRIGR|nr:hypothetical protein I79_009251 [Cricetulus griseus]
MGQPNFLWAPKSLRGVPSCLSRRGTPSHSKKQTPRQTVPGETSPSYPLTLIPLRTAATQRDPRNKELEPEKIVYSTPPKKTKKTKPSQKTQELSPLLPVLESQDHLCRHSGVWRT